MKRLLWMAMLCASCTTTTEQRPIVIAEGLEQKCVIQRSANPEELARRPGSTAVYVVRRDEEALVISVWESGGPDDAGASTYRVAYQAVR